MQTISLTYDGTTYSEWEVPDLLAKGVPAAFIASETARQTGLRATRGQINMKAGDTASILGTTSDAATLAIFGIASLVAKLSTAESLEEVREAAMPFAELSAAFLAKVESGEVVLPFMLKGIESVVVDIETRATAVSGALQAAQTGGDHN